MQPSGKRRVVDAHIHLYDRGENVYPFLDHVDKMFEALIGDYSDLPRHYLLDDYLHDESAFEIAGIIWHEFLSADPVREVQWAQRFAENAAIPMSIVGLVDFLAPDLEATLETYAGCANVSAVREHLGWDEDRPMRRFAKRPGLLLDEQWRKGLNVLNGKRFKCSIEVFSSQLADLLPVVSENPNLGFTIAVMGWPNKTDRDEFDRWKSGLRDLSRRENVHITISALECVFGMNWPVALVRPWVQTVFELFGSNRIMLGSHRPISKLASNFDTPFAAYEQLTADLSPTEQDAVFRRNAAEWFFGEA
jgi:predicted TIM-barrel fold metal-dependent hydrolase